MRSSPPSLPFGHRSVGFLKPFLCFSPAESVQGCWEDLTQQRTLSPGRSWCPTLQPQALVLTLAGEGDLARRLHFTHHFSPLSLPNVRANAAIAVASAGESVKGRGRDKGWANPGKNRQSCCKIKSILFFFLTVFFCPFLIHSSKLAKIKCAIYLRGV